MALCGVICLHFGGILRWMLESSFGRSMRVLQRTRIPITFAAHTLLGQEQKGYGVL